MIAPVQHIRATTWHGRKGALKNAFRYSVDYVLLDAERDGPAPGLFSRKSGLFCGLLDRDHGGPQKRGIGAPWVRQVIRDRGLDLDGPILLLAQPRIWGHVFNPVSFWLLHNRDNELCAVIAEVTIPLAIVIRTCVIIPICVPSHERIGCMRKKYSMSRPFSRLKETMNSDLIFNRTKCSFGSIWIIPTVV